MSSNQPTPECYNFSISQTYFAVSEVVFYISYYGISPEANLFMVISCLLILRASYIAAKSEGAYWYHIFVTFLDCARCTCGSFYDQFNAVVGVPGYEHTTPSALYLRAQYGFMVMKCNFISPLINSLAVAGLLLSFCLAADRVTALWNPMKYKNLNHRLRQRVCLGTCLVIGFSVSTFDCFRWKVIASSLKSTEHGTIYQAVLNQAYTTTAIYINLNLLRNVVRFGSLALLIVTNIALLVLYNKRMKKSMEIRANDDQKTRSIKRNQRVLLIMTVSQSLTKTLVTCCVLAVYTLYAYYPTINKCGFTLLNALLDSMAIVLPTVDFCIVVSVSKSYRHMLRKGVGCVRSDTVAATPQNNRRTATTSR